MFQALKIIIVKNVEKKVLIKIFFSISRSEDKEESLLNDQTSLRSDATSENFEESEVVNKPVAPIKRQKSREHHSSSGSSNKSHRSSRTSSKNHSR